MAGGGVTAGLLAARAPPAPSAAVPAGTRGGAFATVMPLAMEFVPSVEAAHRLGRHSQRWFDRRPSGCDRGGEIRAASSAASACRSTRRPPRPRSRRGSRPRPRRSCAQCEGGLDPLAASPCRRSRRRARVRKRPQSARPMPFVFSDVRKAGAQKRLVSFLLST